MAQVFSFSLFIAGHSSRSETAVRNLHSLCERWIPGRYRISVVDVLESPEMAEHSRILATPTLVRQLPLPSLRVVGDLSDQARVALALGLQSSDDVPPAS